MIAIVILSIGLFVLSVAVLILAVVLLRHLRWHADEQAPPAGSDIL